MKPLNRWSRFTVALLAGVTCWSTFGCETAEPPPDDGIAGTTPAEFSEEPVATPTIVSGTVWDPEAYWMSLAECLGQGAACPLPPIRLTGSPLWQRALVQGASVTMLDPLDPTTPVLSTPAPTKADGIWALFNVPTRNEVPYVLMAAPDPSTEQTLDPVVPFLTPVPPTDYLPTLSLRPVFTGYTFCIGQFMGLMSSTGILEAVAKFRTQNGQATTVADLVDPQKFGGVLVVWAYGRFAAGPFVVVPALGVEITASGGERHTIEWAPPGFPGLPPQVTEIQSQRGFFVNPDSTASQTGVAVFLLPPSAPPGTPVQVTLHDPVESAPDLRPYTFPPLPPLTLAPGVVSWLEMAGFDPEVKIPPPSFTCLY